MWHFWHKNIKNNAFVTVNNDFLVTSGVVCQLWRHCNVNHWQITSRVTKKSLFTVTNVLFYFLHAILYLEHTVILNTPFRYKQSSIAHFAIVARDGLFLTWHCDVITVDLWRHANARHWHCDVIFIDCSCTRKLAQRRSSLVNNNREYRFLTTRYSRLSV